MRKLNAKTIRKRIIAGGLVCALMLDFGTNGNLGNIFSTIEKHVARVNASSEIDLISNSDCYIFNAANQTVEKELLLHNFKEYYRYKDQYNASYLSQRMYCRMGSSDGYNMIDVKKLENSFKEDITAKNSELKSLGCDDLISYNPKTSGLKNYMDNENGVVSDETQNVDSSNLPNSLTLNKNGIYAKTVNVSNYKDKLMDTIDFNFKANITYADLTDIKVDVISISEEGKDEIIYSNYAAESLGKREITCSGSIDVKDLNEKIKIKITNKRNSSVSLSNLKFTMTEPPAALSKVYLTKNPLPAEGEEIYEENASENPKNTLQYKPDDADSMFVVMQFDGSVKLNKMVYYDGEIQQEYYEATKFIADGMYAYPRLALSTTDSSNVEQNSSDSVIYADYYGTMSGELNDNVSEDSCLIFKLDMTKWKNKTFSIASLSQQINRKSRSGNMEWLYKGLEPLSYYTEQEDYLTSVYNNYKRAAKEDYFKGAIVDASGNRVSVSQCFPLQSVEGKDQNGKTANRIPVYEGSSPAIKEVVITSEDGGKYVKPGDYVNIDVVFNCKLDESLKTPTFYLNDYKDFDKELSADTVDDFDGTVVKNGSYSDSKLVPLNVSLDADDDNISASYVEEGTSVSDNHVGKATMTITGIEDEDNTEVYYRVYDESQMALNVNDTFDIAGWTKYEGSAVELTKLPTVIYEQKAVDSDDANVDALNKRVMDGGFIDICQVKLTEDEDGDTVYRVLKFGESDEIDTTADSEKAMLQVNNEASQNSVIKYKVKVNSAKNVDNLYLLGGDSTYYNYEYCLSNLLSNLYFEGTVKSETGRELSNDTLNFGVFSVDENDNKKLVSYGLQSSYVGVDTDSPVVKVAYENTEEYIIGDAVSKAIFNYSDYSKDENGIIRDLSGFSKAKINIGKINGNIDITVKKGQDEIASDTIKMGEDYILSNINLKSEESKSAEPITVEVKRNASDPSVQRGAKSVYVPITFCVYDGAGNIGKYEQSLELPVFYASFTESDTSEYPKIEDYYAYKGKEEDGIISKRIYVNKNDDFNMDDLKVYIADADELKSLENNKESITVDDITSMCEEGEDTCFEYKFEDEYIDKEVSNDYQTYYSMPVSGKIMNFDDSDYNTTTGRLNGTVKDYSFDLKIEKADSYYSLTAIVPARSKINKSLLIYYDSPQAGTYVSSEGYPYEKFDLNMDTLNQPCYVTIDDSGVVERVSYRGTIDKNSEEFEELMENVVIEPVEGSLMEDGSFKRSNAYRFNLINGSGDENVNINWNAFSTFTRSDMPSYIHGTVPADALTGNGYVFDTSKIPLSYVDSSLYDSITINGTKVSDMELSEDELKTTYIKLGVPDDFGVFKGSSWLRTYDLSFYASTTRDKVVKKYN
ncbi:MAG: hypothetical protein K6G11_02160, partial [Lachnospiraceae bacterium]|nr:hypothetical protein [Lachnospiraceae bacterium]